jgi:pyruvate/2-oxoglutarate dehydrogenase complex dihydrolipoamide dehydrogenase (E3) component
VCAPYCPASQPSNRRIYSAGDACLEHKFTHTADVSARIVVQNALFLGRQAEAIKKAADAYNRTRLTPTIQSLHGAG